MINYISKSKGRIKIPYFLCNSKKASPGFA